MKVDLNPRPLRSSFFHSKEGVGLPLEAHFNSTRSPISASTDDNDANSVSIIGLSKKDTES